MEETWRCLWQTKAKLLYGIWVWWHSRQRWEDLCEFQTSLGYSEVKASLNYIQVEVPSRQVDTGTRPGVEVQAGETDLEVVRVGRDSCSTAGCITQEQV